MKNSAVNVVREDLMYLIRRKIQIIMSKLSCEFGWRKFDPEDFKIEHIEVTIPKLPLVFHNYRILHISDIHFGQWISSERLSGVVDLINQNNPDLIAITGDFVSYLVDDNIEKMMIDQLKRLKPNDASVAVLGNHDHWSGAKSVQRILQESNIYNISNDVYPIWRGDYQLNIAGVDSVAAKKDCLDLVMEKMQHPIFAELIASITYRTY